MTGKPADAAIFISYRRDDDPAFAGRLYDKLTATFGPENVFIDVDAIELGLDFTVVIDRSLSQCKALVAVIGKEWLDAADDEGVRRLAKPDDFVRLEIETALTRGIRVIPVLVNGARMPVASELPEALAAFANRHAIAMSHAKFGKDASELIWILTKIMKSGRSEGKVEPERGKSAQTSGN
jgi:hypothetical protein